jgi:hypothetical protein
MAFNPVADVLRKASRSLPAMQQQLAEINAAVTK